MKGPHSPLEAPQQPPFEVFLLLQVMRAPQAQPWPKGLLWGAWFPSHCPAEGSWSHLPCRTQP